MSPQATLLGCRVGRCTYLATGITVLQGARLGAGAVVAVGALVHANADVPAEWTDRVARYERITEVRVAEFAAHADDEVL